MGWVPVPAPPQNISHHCWCGGQWHRLGFPSWTTCPLIILFGSGCGWRGGDDADMPLPSVRDMRYGEEVHAGTDIDDCPLLPPSQPQWQGLWWGLDGWDNNNYYGCNGPVGVPEGLSTPLVHIGTFASPIEWRDYDCDYGKSITGGRTCTFCWRPGTTTMMDPLVVADPSYWTPVRNLEFFDPPSTIFPRGNVNRCNIDLRIK